MGSHGHISFPPTPEGKVVAKYFSCQETKDFSKGSEIFTEDVVFHGLLYKVKGRKELLEGFQDFVDNMLISIRVEAVSQADENRFLMLHFIKMIGSDEEVPAVDLLTMRDGKICRVDNCFDVGKVSQTVKDDAKAASG